MVNHTGWCRTLKHSDAAKRVSDEYNMHRIADCHGSIGKWVAFALADGTSDHQLYDTKHSAVRHQHHNEQWYFFAQIRPVTMAVCETEAMLNMHRRMYDAGVRLIDPSHAHGGRDMINRVSREDQGAQLRTVLSGGRSAPTNIRFEE